MNNGTSFENMTWPAYSEIYCEMRGDAAQVFVGGGLREIPSNYCYNLIMFDLIKSLLASSSSSSKPGCYLRHGSG